MLKPHHIAAAAAAACLAWGQPVLAANEPTRTATPTTPVTPMAPTAAPQPLDYSANLKSEVFGSQLFTGAFAHQGATQFNPDYAITIGDKIQVRLWGAYELDTALTVDAQGNIFLPNAGPVPVVGVRNQDLQPRVERAVAKVFRSNVSSYASLAGAQPVRIFVSGNVNRPGLYHGTSLDSLLHYLDQAGGIDPERGTFLNVQVKRGRQVRASVNLYDFLLQGSMPQVQLSEGDVIFVAPRQHSVKVSGLAANAKRFEFSDAQRSVADLLPLAKPAAAATHVRVTRNTGTRRNVEYYPLADAAGVLLQNGDELEFTADKKPGTITVRVEGEHQSAQEYVLPYGSSLESLMQKIQIAPDAELESLQLFRQSVKLRQKEMLERSLTSLESALLSARSGSAEEAQLRKEEAELTLKWVERAKKIEPVGQVVIAQVEEKSLFLLENGDILRIPRKDNLVLVSGEVLFPNAVAFSSGLSVRDYINSAGGFTQVADNARVVVARRNGTFEQVALDSLMVSTRVKAGDEILVLPKVDEKKRQFWKDMTQIVYQIAVGAKIVFGL